MLRRKTLKTLTMFASFAEKTCLAMAPARSSPATTYFMLPVYDPGFSASKLALLVVWMFLALAATRRTKIIITPTTPITPITMQMTRMLTITQISQMVRYDPFLRLCFSTFNSCSTIAPITRTIKTLPAPQVDRQPLVQQTTTPPLRCHLCRPWTFTP